jgi:sugar/nucleoside kinase (ribokinase family)
MAHSDLGYLFPNGTLQDKIREFKTYFGGSHRSKPFKGILGVTHGGKAPLFIDMETDNFFEGVIPQPLDPSREITRVGAGDNFSGGLFAQLFPRLVSGKRIQLCDIAPCIAAAHKAAADHIYGIEPDPHTPVRQVPSSTHRPEALHPQEG